MSRFTPIRITKNDRDEYAQLAKRAKAKLNRTKRNYQIDLSNDIPVPSLSDFSTRKEFNEWKEKISSFTNRNNQRYQFVKNQYGVVASKSQLNKINRDTKTAQRIADRRREEAENKPFISGGKQQGTQGQRLKMMARPNMIGYNRPKDFNFQDVRNKQRLKTVEESMKDRANPNVYNEQLDRLKNNFIEQLEKAFNSEADELIDMIKQIPSDDFYEMYKIFDEFDFDMFYTELMEGYDHSNQINLMKAYVNRYFKGDVNMDLKGVGGSK